MTASTFKCFEESQSCLSKQYPASNMRLLPFIFLALTSLLAPSASAPAIGALAPRQGARTCDAFATLSSGPFQLQTNQWGAQTGVGSQCSTIDRLNNGNSLAWTTSWTWANNPNNVKSYTNVQSSQFSSRRLSEYSSIQTTWDWK